MRRFVPIAILVAALAAAAGVLLATHTIGNSGGGAPAHAPQFGGACPSYLAGTNVRVLIAGEGDRGCQVWNRARSTGASTWTTSVPAAIAGNSSWETVCVTRRSADTITVSGLVNAPSVRSGLAPQTSRTARAICASLVHSGYTDITSNK